MVLYALIIGAVLVVVAVVLAVRKQSQVTQNVSQAEQIQNTKVFQESTQRIEANVAEKLAEKARDPRLSSMTQEDLVYEVLKECYDPEIPLNVVDLGLVYEVKVLPDEVNVKMTMTSPMGILSIETRQNSGNISGVLIAVGYEDDPLQVVRRKTADRVIERVGDVGLTLVQDVYGCTRRHLHFLQVVDFIEFQCV